MTTNNFSKLKISIISTAVLTALAGMPSYAQEADSNVDEKQTERIMVTSRKKSESIIEVPMNISTVNAMDIADRNLLQKEDLFRTIAGAASPRGELVLRGLSGSNNSGSILSPIGTTTTFTDGIPYDFSDLYDVERVEVLRGPQGTLWGSNAIGGTVQVITKRPQLDELEVSASIQANSEKSVEGLDQRLYGMMNMPISDSMALRVTGSTSDQPLSITNVNTGVQGNIKESFLRAQLLWQASDDLSFNFGVVREDYLRIGTDVADFATGIYSGYEAQLTSNEDAPFGYDVDLVDREPCDLPRLECLSSGNIAGGTDPRYNAWELMDRRTDRDVDLYTLNIRHDNLFDMVSMNYDGSFRHYDYYKGTSANWSRSDGQDLFRTWIINDFQYKRTTHELRFSNLETDSNFDWTAGFFYDKDEKGKGPNIQHQYHGDGDQGKAIATALWGDAWGYLSGGWEGDDGNVVDLTTVAELGEYYWGNPDINYSEETLLYYAEEIAFFGEASYTMDTDVGEFELTAGIRFFELEDREANDIRGIWGSTSSCAEGETEDCTRPDLPADVHIINKTDQGGDESGNRKKFSVSWRPDNDMSVYALYSEGYRPGGNNIAILPVACRTDPNAKFFQTRYESDSIDNYEVGFKGIIFGGNTRVSTAVYQIDWTGVQVDIDMGCGFGFTANAAEARSRGLELETSTSVTDDLTLTFNAGYTQAELLTDVDSINAKAGDDMTQVPKYNVYFALDQGFEVFNRQAYVRLDVESYDEYNSYFNGTDEDVIPSYSKVNLSGRIELKDGINASIHVKNLLDKDIITWKSATGNGYGDYHYVQYANGRNVTFRLDFAF